MHKQWSLKKQLRRTSERVPQGHNTAKRSSSTQGNFPCLLSTMIIGIWRPLSINFWMPIVGHLVGSTHAATHTQAELSTSHFWQWPDAAYCLNA